MHRFGKQLLAAAGVGAILLGGSYGYGRYRVQSLLRLAVAPSLQFASLRLEPDWSRLQVRDVSWTEAGEQRRVDCITIERPVDVIRSGRWHFDTVSLEGLQLEGFGGAEHRIGLETERRMRQHGLMLAEDTLSELSPDISTIVRTAVARNHGRWSARLASVRLQTQQVGDAAEVALRRDLPDTNPLRGRRDAKSQFAELQRLESQLAAIDGGLMEDADRWQDESQRLREECAEAIREARAAAEDHLRRRHRERVEANLAALRDALVESIVARFVPPMAAAAQLARTSHNALLETQTPAETRGTDFFGLKQARSIRVDRLIFSGSAADADRTEFFSGEMFPQPDDDSANQVVDAGPPALRHSIVVLCGSRDHNRPRLRLGGSVSNDGVVRLASAATLERFETSAETPTFPNFGLTLAEPDFRMTYQDDSGRVTCRVEWSSREATVRILDHQAGGREVSETQAVDLQEFCGSLEVQVTPDLVQIDSDLDELQSIIERFAADPAAEKIASAAGEEPAAAAIETAVSEMLAVRRADCRRVRSQLAEMRQTLATRHEAIARQTGGSGVRTASGSSAAGDLRPQVR